MAGYGLGRFLFLLLHRPAVQALRSNIAIDELDHRHGRGIAVPDAGLQHSALAPMTRAIPVRQCAKQLPLASLILWGPSRWRIKTAEARWKIRLSTAARS
jgi:hypothetical protein